MSGRTAMLSATAPATPFLDALRQLLALLGIKHFRRVRHGCGQTLTDFIEFGELLCAELFEPRPVDRLRGQNLDTFLADFLDGLADWEDIDRNAARQFDEFIGLLGVRINFDCEMLGHPFGALLSVFDRFGAPVEKACFMHHLSIVAGFNREVAHVFGHAAVRKGMRRRTGCGDLADRADDD